MNYILAFLVNLLALNIWLWLFQSAFQRKQKKWLIALFIVIMGVISTGAMIAYPLLLRYIHLTTFSVSSLSLQSIVFLIGYIGIIGLLISLFGKKNSLKQKVFLWTVSFIALALWIAVGYITLPLWIILYFLCTAGAEEFLKLSVGQSFFSQYGISKKDLLLFSILSAVGFALIENIVYLFQNPSIGLAVSRNLTTVIMHVIFTGVIAYIIMTRGEKRRWRYVIAFLVGMALHRCYNTFISYNNPIITAIMIIVWYFVISYFLYKSDRLYLAK